MASNRSSEEHPRGMIAQALNSGESVGCYYLHYQADRPMKYDIAFRRFIISTTLHDRAHLVPVRFGPGRKFTSEGVVKVLGTCIVPTACKYQGSFLKWTLIPLPVYEKYRVSAATKVYFRGFPLDASQQDVANTFRIFGSLQYVYLMCDSANKTRSNKQGYIIFEYRDSVERLLSIGQALSFKGFPIYFEEYKSKKSSQAKNDQSGLDILQSIDMYQNPNCRHTKESYTINSPPIFGLKPSYFTFGAAGREMQPGLTNQSYNDQKVYNFSGFPTRDEEISSFKPQSLLKPILRFKPYIESNTANTHNLRFNRSSLIRDFGHRHAAAYRLNQRFQLAN